MKGSTLIKIAWQSIIKNKMRTLLTMLGIVIGVGAVIVMVAIGEGAQSKIQRQIDGLGTNLIVITPGASRSGGVSHGAQTYNRLTVDDADKIRRESVFVNAVSPILWTRTQIIGGSGNWRTSINGVTADYALIRNWNLKYGRFFDHSEVQALRRVVVLGHTVAEHLFPEEDPTGRRIRIRNVPVEVIGVLEPKGQTASGTNQDDVILAPYTSVQTRLSGWRRIFMIVASTASSTDIERAKQEITTIMRESHRLSEWEDNDFTVRNQNDIADTAQSATRVMTILLAMIASISLLVGGIGIMNIMLVSVTERTREIGIRMAIGARGRDVMTQFLVESIVMSMIGGIIGVGIGVICAALVGQATGWSTSISPDIVAIALFFSAGVGIFFGFYPARKAAVLNPIDALRYE